MSDVDLTWRPRHNPWAVALTVTMATFMEVLDTSIANVSLPHIAGNLAVTFDESTWILTSYLVSNAVVLPVSGWLATRIGRKRFYMACVAIFTVSSFLCGIAPSLGFLLFFRIIQGLGGGGLGPSEQAILADTFPPSKRGMAFAVYGMAVVLAPALGPTLGGWITDHLSWRWVFFINVPVGIASLMLTQRMVEDPPWLAKMRAKAGGIDYVGLSLVAIGLGCLEVVLDKGQEDDWFQSRVILAFAVIAVLALILFIVWEYLEEHPVVDIRLFKNRNFATANLMMLVLGGSLYGTTVLLPQYLQTIMGYTAERAGNTLSMGGVAVMLMMPLVGVLVSRWDPRFLVAFGFTAVAIALFYMAHHLYQGMDFWTAAKLRIYQAVGLAFLFVPINTLVYAGIPPEKNNSVSGIVNLSRNVGGSIGIAFVTTLIARRSVLHQNRLVSHLAETNPGVAERLALITRGLAAQGSSTFVASQRALGALIRVVWQQAQTLAYLDTIWLFAAAAACMVPLIFLMRRPSREAAPAGH
ncbi:MAG TPA: DHA2 family efflux MFS transporter permease subunit [Myxococcaceae bacterium]|nr:DHA2 family efflux MFS transporter permease subunit [Myxococcaceae bacterium]